MTDSDTTSGNPPDPTHRERYPWHARPWSVLAGDANRLPHALLLHGPAGLGKQAFAWRLAESLLCLEPGTEAAACGGCSSCRLFAAGTHPDLLAVRPLEDSQTIAIDQIRRLREFVALRPHTSARKLVILEPAEAMNLNSSNALLKVLEEPPATSLLLLITPRAARLPATIRSRCTLVPFRPPPRAEAVAWLSGQGVTDGTSQMLDLAGGAPLRALASARGSKESGYGQFTKDVEALRTGAEDPLRCAARWKSYGAAECLEWFQRYLIRLIQAEMIDENNSLKNKNKSKDLFRYLDVISESRSLVPGPLDEGLMLEDILIGWTRVSRPMV